MRTREYRVSERTTLRPGVVFRATGGPRYVLESGESVSIAARGPFVFIAAQEDAGRVLLEAYDRGGCHAILHVKGSRTPGDDRIVPAPYVIKGVKRKVKNLDTKRRAAATAEVAAKADRRPKKRRKPRG